MTKVSNSDWEAEELENGNYRLFNKQTKSALVANIAQLKSLIGIVEQIE